MNKIKAFFKNQRVQNTAMTIIIAIIVGVALSMPWGF